VALALVAGALAWKLLDAERAVARIQLADTNLETATLITAYMVDEETGLRAYQTTGDHTFLQPYEAAAEPLRSNIRHLRENLIRQGGNPELVDRVKAQHVRWVGTVAEPIIATIQAGGDTRDPRLNLRAKGQMDEMRLLLQRIKTDQVTRRTHAVEVWSDEFRHAIEALIGSALALGLLIGIFSRNQLHLVSDAFQRTLNALRQHAQATYDSEQRLRAILGSLGEAVVVCNLDGCIELMNPAAEQLSGWSLADALGKAFETVFPLKADGTPQLTESAIQAVRRELRIIKSTQSLTLKHPDGTERTVDESGAPVYERNGALACVVLVLRDSTQQRRTQAALLASEKLAVAGRLAATIAHEIHNPLDSVANLIYLMRTGPQSDENAQFLDMAQGELSRATQISRALLGMYRESRTAVALDLSSLLRSVLILLERRFRQDGVQMKTDLIEPAVVTGFPAELRQVFTNLLVNAAEASPRGNMVTVSTRLTFGGQDIDGLGARQPGVLVTVEDSGAGVPDDVQPQLFQPFFSTKGEAGTGLGLWVSKGIVDKHGGTIELTSSTEPDLHGTRVTVFLPRGQSEWTDAENRSNTAAAANAHVTNAAPALA
jgi:PAS domain S-box-containing protein